MQRYTKIYFDHFGYGEQDFVFCEVHWVQGRSCRAVDINHIDARGMGGNPSGNKDDIKNLMAVCREIHIQYGDKKEEKPFLRQVHATFMESFDLSKASTA